MESLQANGPVGVRIRPSPLATIRIVRQVRRHQPPQRAVRVQPRLSCQSLGSRVGFEPAGGMALLLATDGRLLLLLPKTR